MPRLSHHPVLDYSQITPYIFVGTNMCCQVHFEEELLAKGIKVDISLERERLDSPEGVEAFLWLPIKDHYAPSRLQLQLGVELLEEIVELKKQVYVHCKNGHGRAPTLVAAYLMAEQGMSVAEAIAFIKKRRPSIHLHPRQRRSLSAFYADSRAD